MSSPQYHKLTRSLNYINRERSTKRPRRYDFRSICFNYDLTYSIATKIQPLTKFSQNKL